ncbi:endonuclease III [bacterium]|nr:endonuclease III [bacterium]|tara:strand:+ start:1173 stop:1991 length:819 start_codon:yes stop_codon:yes gene_type:complete
MHKKDQQFITTVHNYYCEHGRHSLLWRRTNNPYRIVVSEIMLQQTQVDRVVPKYRAFLRQFPTAKKLATASLAEVIKVWQGLGYNRRAKLLQQCAQVITNEYGGRWPQTYIKLTSLPGIGPYTAGAVMAFAYNQAVPLIETNVRTVYLHHFFPNDTDVTDKYILTLVERHLPHVGDARVWYAALMDYGSYLKKTHGNPNSRAAGYVKQSTFKGSDREVRGAIVRTLTQTPQSRTQLRQALKHLDTVKIDAQLERLLAEAMIIKQGREYQLST